MRPTVALLTDFGTRDHYVSVMKGVMKDICNEIDFIDITHDIPSQDVRAGAFTLVNAYAYFPLHTVFLVVVDPGVGTARRPIFVSTSQYSFVAPDNGVLSFVLDRESTAKCFEVNQDQPPPPAQKRRPNSTTFHGRDIFAPAAARAACGEHEDFRDDRRFFEYVADKGFIVSRAGEIDLGTLVGLPSPDLAYADNLLTGEVLYIDHFGNVITSIGELAWKDDHTVLVFDAVFDRSLPGLQIPATATVKYPGGSLDGIKPTYGQTEPGEPLALISSSGYLEIAVNQGSAAAALRLNVGDTINITIPEEG